MSAFQNISPNDLSLSVLNLAMVHAANALGKMMQEEVLLSRVQFSPQKWDWKGESDDLYVMRTDIKGDFAGETYLVVVPEDEPPMSDVLLPGSLQARPEMREAILLEVDNILIAALVTRLSEVLRSQIIGDVPEAQGYTRESLNTFFTEKVNDSRYEFSFSSEFVTLGTGIRMNLVGFFEDSFMKRVAHATDPEYHKKDTETSYISKSSKGLFKKILPW
ncbi:MAG: hypothetical protein AAF740_01110 [Bacteroidota bacterium]